MQKKKYTEQYHIGIVNVVITTYIIVGIFLLLHKQYMYSKGT